VKVLVTGGSSLLGSAVARQLLARGDAVTCFQRRPSDTGAADVLGDVRDGDAVRSATEGHDAVVHLAALVAPRPAWADAYAVNVVGTGHVVDAAVSCGRLVHVSSPSVAFDDRPAVGAGAGEARYAGDDAYTHTKALAERLVLRRSSVPTVVLRPHLVWGPGDTQLIGRIVERARQGRLALPDHGRSLVDTTYVDDAAAAVVAGLDRTADTDEAWGCPWVVTGDDPRPPGAPRGGRGAPPGPPRPPPPTTGGTRRGHPAGGRARRGDPIGARAGGVRGRPTRRPHVAR